jgi:hypothetical protein
MQDLIEAAERVFDTEITPGSEATRQAFRTLRERIREARETLASM